MVKRMGGRRAMNREAESRDAGARSENETPGCNRSPIGFRAEIAQLIDRAVAIFPADRECAHIGVVGPRGPGRLCAQGPLIYSAYLCCLRFVFARLFENARTSAAAARDPRHPCFAGAHIRFA